MPIGPPSQVPLPKSACRPAPRPMLVIQAAERGWTGSRETGACQTLSAGNSGQPEAPRDAPAAPAGVAVGANAAIAASAVAASSRAARARAGARAGRRGGREPGGAGRRMGQSYHMDGFGALLGNWRLVVGTRHSVASA